MTPTPGRILLFYPKQECVSNGDTKIQSYPSIVTQVNPDQTLELATFGPNSLYFQHNVPMYGQRVPATNEHPEYAYAWGWQWPPKV